MDLRIDICRAALRPLYLSYMRTLLHYIHSPGTHELDNPSASQQIQYTGPWIYETFLAKNL